MQNMYTGQHHLLKAAKNYVRKQKNIYKSVRYLGLKYTTA